MIYCLRLVTLGKSPVLPLTVEEFSALESNKRILNAAFRLEETYSYVVANYLDFERALLDTSLTSAIQNMQSYSEIQTTWSALSLKLVNLLTTTRLYLDQSPQIARDCLRDDNDTIEKVKAFRSEQYDKKFDYRFMEALRNHVQHCGAAIHYFRPNQEVMGDEGGHFEYQYDVLAKKENLAENPAFKSSVLDEMPDEVSLRAAAREYVESVSAIHENIRKLVADATEAARRTIEAAHSRYKGQCPAASSTAIAAVAVEDDQTQKTVPLLLEWDDVRIQLQRRNPYLANLALRHVTNKTGRRPSESKDHPHEHDA